MTTSIAGRKALLQKDVFARLFVDCLLRYRDAGKYGVHAFVVMPDHVHALITPLGVTLERAMQYIKGGFSHAMGRDFGWRGEIWQRGYHDRRVRDGMECAAIVEYIHLNPVNRALCAKAEEFLFGSASGSWPMDPLPQRLKPLAFCR